MKTTARNQQWQSDYSYFFVVSWGWYYLISVLDDYTRMILAWALKRDMTSASISDVVEQAMEFTGMKDVPVEDRTRLLTDRGSGYLADAFEDYLRTLEIRHIDCAPHHPQTNGKLERFHETIKARLNLLVYSSPWELERTMADFIDYYNHRAITRGSATWRRPMSRAARGNPEAKGGVEAAHDHAADRVQSRPLGPSTSGRTERTTVAWPMGQAGLKGSDDEQSLP